MMPQVKQLTNNGDRAMFRALAFNDQKSSDGSATGYEEAKIWSTDAGLNASASQKL